MKKFLFFSFNSFIILLFLLAVGKVTAQLYQHDFGNTVINSHPYTQPPAILDLNLIGSSWSNSNFNWTSFQGSTGQAIALNNSSGTPTITLTFNVASDYKLSITEFNFWRQRSNSGAQNWSMTINEIPVGNGTIPTTGTSTLKTTVANTVRDLTGTITVVISLSGASGTGTFRLDDFSLYGTVIQAGKTSNCAVCNWNDPNAWLPVGIPAETDMVTIRSSDIIYNPNANLLRSAATNVNGSFQIQQGSSVDTASQDFNYGSTGTLIFNNSSPFYGVNSDDKFWPYTNGPVNVRVLQGGFSLNGGTSRIIAGNLETAAGISIAPGENLTVNGITTINTNGFFSSTPTFGTLSTLVYKNQTGYNVGNEWNGNSATSGKGVPKDVHLISSVLNFPNFDHGLAGNLNIDSNSTLNLNSSAGDLYLAGNWTKTGTFNPNSRAVFFNGASVQTITGTTTFDYLTLNNPAGLTLANNIVNNFTLNFLAGNLILGTNDLTIGSSGTTINATASKYVVTDGVGQLKRTVGSVSTLFPVGNSTYNPIIFANSGMSDMYGVRVADLTPAGPNPAKAVNRQWITTEANADGSNLSVVAQYNNGETGVDFMAAGDPFIGFYDGTNYTQQVAAALGANPFTATSNTNLTPVDLTTGTKYFAIGKDNAFISTPTQLVFKLVPPTGIAGMNLPPFTVEAQDVYNNVVKNFTGDIALSKITGSGNISGTLTRTAVAGVSAFNNIQFDAADTYTIRSSSGSLTSAVSGNIVIAPNPANAYFRSKATGNWATTGSWESSPNGSTGWATASVAPTAAANTITIQGGHIVTIDTNVTLDQLIIENGGKLLININAGKLNINDGPGNDIDIENGGVFQVVANSNESNIRYSDKINFIDSASINVYGKIEIGNGSNFMGGGYGEFGFASATQIVWNHSSVLEWNTTGSVPGFAGQTYFPGVDSSTVPTFRITKIGGGNVGGGPTVINGIVQLNGASLSWQGDGTKVFRNGISTVGTGNITASSGSGTWEVGDATGSATAELGGSTGNLTLTNANGISILNSCYATLTSNINFGTNTKFTVDSGAILDFGFDTGGNALNIIRSGNQVGQKFELKAGGTLKITSPDGIVSGSSTPATNLYKGNVQIGSTLLNRIFSGDATYHFIGKANQSTGNGIPDQITRKLIVELDTQNSTQDDLEFRSTGTTTFGTKGGGNGILEIIKGKVFDEPGSGFRNYNGALEDGEDATQRGNLVILGGRYVVSGSGTKPSLSGTYTLNAGTVEFAGTAATKIRTGVPPKQYFNVDVSGSNVESGGKNLIVNNLLKVTNAAVFTVPEETDSANPYVVTAKKGIQVAAGGKALFLNNANLLQDTNAANSGNISMQRKATVPSNQYNYWSSPVAGQPLYSLYDVPANAVMTYNSWNDKFTILPTASNPLSIFAKGYSIKGSPTMNPVLTAEFVGTPNNETTAGTNSIALSTSGNNYNLIGNPYPSNLDLVALYNDAANTDKFYNGFDETPTVYFWDNTSNTDTTQQGTAYVNQNYALLNLPSGVGISAPRTGLSKKPNGIVKPGQGFIIRAAETGGDLIFKNDFRTTSVKVGPVDGVYFKGGYETMDKFWLILKTPNSINIETALAYHPEAEDSFERFDSVIFSEAVSENFYSLSSDSKKLAVQTRKGDFDSSDIIPLGIKTSKTGIQKISIDEKQGVFEFQTIYLNDKTLNIITDLSAGFYEFTSPLGIDNNRFELIYKPGTVLGTEANTAENLQVYRSGENFIIQSSAKKITEVEVYDSSGRLYRKLLTNTLRVDWEASDIASGMYVLKIKMTDETVTKKIIK